MELTALDAAVSAALAKTADKPEFRGKSPREIAEALATNEMPEEHLRPFWDILNAACVPPPMPSNIDGTALAKSAGLTDLQRRAMQLHLDGMTYKQVAARLQIDEAVAKRELTTAGTALRAALFARSGKEPAAAVEELQRIAWRILTR